VTGLAGDDLGDGNTLILGLVGQHRTGDDVADGVDARHIGGVMRVGADAATLIERHTHHFEPEALGVGLAADGHERYVEIGQFHVAAGRRFHAGGERAVFLLVDRLDLGRELELHALLLQHALHLPGGLAVEAGDDAVEELDDGHLRAQPRPDRPHLEPDNARADDEQALGHFLERQRAGGGDDLFLVDLDARQVHRDRAGRNDDVLGLDGLARPLVGRHQDAPRRADRADAAEGGDLVLLEQEIDARDIGGHGVVLVRHHLLQVELGRRDVDAERLELVAGFLEELRSMQQGLGRDAADIEAGATVGGPFLDHRDLHAELRGADGGNIAARPRTDYREVERISHDVSEPLLLRQMRKP
jgi:hypothetical protein